MKLTELRFHNYKAFPLGESIEVRPLTVLIGRNSSGKSALARLPLLLGHALSGRGDAPLDLSVQGVEFGGTFMDLIHGRNVHGSISLGLTLQSTDGSHSFDATIQNVSESGRRPYQIIERVDCSTPRGSLWTLSRTQKSDPDSPKTYELLIRQPEDRRGIRSDDVSFSGLLPRIHGVPEMISDAEIFGRLSRQIRYLAAFRTFPKRLYRMPGAPTRYLDPDGTGAAEFLASDLAWGHGRLLKRVSDWYQRCLGGCALDVRVSDATFELLVLRRDGVEVSLMDVGHGMSQVLPIVVSRFLEETNDSVDRESGQRPSEGNTTLEIVEQPELHLHPAAHGAIADLFVAGVASGRTQSLIETHSETFLLRLRRRVAEGLLSPERVIIYWIDDDPGSNQKQITPIRINEAGDVDSWPQKVFRDAYEEVRELRRVQSQSKPTSTPTLSRM